MGSDVAVVLMSFEKHELLKWCIKCLERNKDIDYYDLIIFQDGAVNYRSGERKTEDENVIESLKVLRDCKIQNRRAIFQYHNIGIARMRDQMFDLYDEGYDLIIQLENGVMAGEDSLKITELMARQFRDCVVTPYRMYPFSNIIKYEEKLNEVRKAEMSQAYFFGMWKETFEEIKDGWDIYMEICEYCDYDNRPHDMIRDHFPGLVSTNSDRVIMHLLNREGIKTVHPMVSRAKYYGHSKKMNDIRYRPYGKEGPAEFPQDENINEFKLKKFL